MEPMPGIERVVVGLPDGRELVTYVDARSTGVPVVFHHGTPGSGRPLTVLVDGARRCGLRWVSISRPGFDGSTRLAGRHIGDIAADTASVLDHLAADRFAVAGWSGGGPHALACGALLPERVTGVLVIAGCAPYPADGLDWTAGMAADDVAEAEAAMHDPGLLRRLVEPREQWYRVATGADLLEAMAGRFSNVDVAALAPHADEFVACIAEGVTPGVDGWIDDWEAMVTPWGFDVADVAVPTLFWHGDRDESCPLAHAQWMCARMPRASVVVQPGDGHLSIGVRRAAEMFAAFMDAMSI